MDIIITEKKAQERVIELMTVQKEYTKYSIDYWFIEGKLSVYQAMLKAK